MSNRVKISVATYEFGQDLRQSLHTAMNMQANGVQFDLRNQLRPSDYGETARRQLKNYLSERNLLPASACFPLRGPLFEQERLEERLAAIRGAIEFASKLRLRTLTLRIGRLPEIDSKEFQNLVFPVVQDLATHGNLHGVTICVIPSGDSSEKLSKLLDLVKTGPLAIDADLAGWVLSGRNTVAELRAFNAVIGHVEIRDGVRDVDGIGQEVPVGRGEIDWDEVAALLFEMNYQGWLNVKRTTGEDKIGDSSRAIQYLRNLMPME